MFGFVLKKSAVQIHFTQIDGYNIYKKCVLKLFFFKHMKSLFCLMTCVTVKLTKVYCTEHQFDYFIHDFHPYHDIYS